MKSHLINKGGKGHNTIDQIQKVARLIYENLPMTENLKSEAEQVAREFTEAAIKHDYWTKDRIWNRYVQLAGKTHAQALKQKPARDAFIDSWGKYIKASWETGKNGLKAIADIMTGDFADGIAKGGKAVAGAKEWGTQMGRHIKSIGDYIGGHNVSAEEIEAGKAAVEADPYYQKKKDEFQLPEYYARGSKNEKEGDKIMKTKSKVRNLTRKGFNHPEWYGKYPNFLSTNLNYGVRKQSEQYATIAAGASLRTALCIPQKDGAVSQAYKDMMNSLFAKLRGSNSGAFNYDVQDVAAYIETTRSIRALHSKLVRDLKALNNIDLYISQTPYPLMLILGYDKTMTDTMILNKASYITVLNQLGLIIDQTFPTPPDMAVYDRDHYVATVLLEEGKGPKSSIYAYVLSEFTSAAGYQADLNRQNIPFGYDLAAQITVLQTMITRARDYVSASYPNRDTFAKIAGDIFKAYGQSGLNRKSDTIDLTSRAEIKFDEYLLHQLQNATNISFAAGTYQPATQATAFNMTYISEIGVAGTDNTKTIPESRIPVIDAGGYRYVNTNKSDITALETLSLTRGNYTLKAKGVPFAYDDTQVYEVKDCATDAVYSITIVRYDANNQLGTSGFKCYSIQAQAFGRATASFWAQLDYMPAVYIYDESDVSGGYEIMLDFDTYAPMTAAQLAQFHDICVMSLYKTVDVSDQVNFRSVKR